MAHNKAGRHAAPPANSCANPPFMGTTNNLCNLGISLALKLSNYLGNGTPVLQGNCSQLTPCGISLPRAAIFLNNCCGGRLRRCAVLAPSPILTDRSRALRSVRLASGLPRDAVPFEVFLTHPVPPVIIAWSHFTSGYRPQWTP